MLDSYLRDSFWLVYNMKAFLELKRLHDLCRGMQTSAVKVENVFFRHIKGTSATEEAIKFACSDYFPCKGLYMEDVHLLSHTGGTTRSFCWQAYGSSQGLVHPSPCFSSSEGFIKEKVPSHFVQSF